MYRSGEDDTVAQFGRHKGKSFAHQILETDRQYLDWAVKEVGPSRGVVAADSAGNLGSPFRTHGEPFRPPDGADEDESGQRARDRLRRVHDHGGADEYAGNATEVGAQRRSSLFGCSCHTGFRATPDGKGPLGRSAESQGGSGCGQRPQREIPQAGESLEVAHEQPCSMFSRVPSLSGG